MRRPPPKEWRARCAAWSAGRRGPTRTEARGFVVCWAAMAVAFGGGRWWGPVGMLAVPAAFGFAYVLWRLRTPTPLFAAEWQERIAVATGWPPRLVVRTTTVLWGLAFVSLVVSWLTQLL